MAARFETISLIFKEYLSCVFSATDRLGRAMDLCVDWVDARLVKLFTWSFYQAILPHKGLMSCMQLRDHGNGGPFGKKRTEAR